GLRPRPYHGTVVSEHSGRNADGSPILMSRVVRGKGACPALSGIGGGTIIAFGRAIRPGGARNGKRDQSGAGEKGAAQCSLCHEYAPVRKNLRVHRWGEVRAKLPFATLKTHARLAANPPSLVSSGD